MAIFTPTNEQRNGPLVSVVMPVRNMEQFLAESIEGILGQTFREFELIILDFGSTDKSKAIASRYEALDDRVKLHEFPACGLAEARNAGSSLAQGRYIAVQDADDVSLPDRLRTEVEFLERNPDAGLVGAFSEWVDVNCKSMHVPGLPTDEQEIKLALFSDFPFCHTSLLIRKDVFDLVGGYRPVMTHAHDYDLAVRISEQFRCANLSQVLVKYRIHLDQVSLSRHREQTLCRLAAQASAALRRAGKADLLNAIREITPASLVTLGVTQAQQESHVAASYERWIDHLIFVGERATALKMTLAVRQSRWQYLDQSRIAEFHFIAARLYWQEKKFTKSLLTLCHAVWKRPALAKRVVESLIWRLQRGKFRTTSIS